MAPRLSQPIQDFRFWQAVFTSYDSKKLNISGLAASIVLLYFVSTKIFGKQLISTGFNLARRVIINIFLFLFRFSIYSCRNSPRFVALKKWMLNSRLFSFSFNGDLFGPFIITQLYYRKDQQLPNCLTRLELMPIRFR